MEKKDYVDTVCCFTQKEGEITGLERNEGYYDKLFFAMGALCVKNKSYIR